MNSGQAIGVDIGGTHTKIALVAADGSILRQTTIPTTAHGNPAPFLASLAAILDDFVSARPWGIGLALPGLFAPDNRSILFNPNTPALIGIDFVTWLERFGLPVHLEQDLNAPALAEYKLGAGQGARRLLVAPIGTGLGAAVMIEGVLLRFAGNTAGDNGHIILAPGGPRCSAGCSGCAEALIAAPAIERAALQSLADPRADVLRAGYQAGRVPARIVIAAAVAGDPVAAEIMHTIGQWLGQWLASLAPIFLPERVVLCGGVAEAGQILLAPCQERFAALVGPDYSHLTITLSQFGGWAGVIGVATLFLFPA